MEFDPELTAALQTLPRMDCGFHAAKDFRKSSAYRENPPACDLPTKSEVEQWCAIHDVITAPGYDGSTDEERNLINPRPVPEYRVTDLSCSWANYEHNKATCRLRLIVPGKAVGDGQITARFNHIYWRDDGPTHHIEGVRWSLLDDCTPDADSDG